MTIGNAQFETCLSDNEAHYHLLAEALPLFIWIFSPSGKIEFCNRFWCDYTGLTLKKTSTNWSSVIHPDDRKQTLKKLKKATRKKSVCEFTCRFRRYSDGSYRWHLGRISPLFSSKGTLLNWIASATDIHERKEAEEALHRSEWKYRLIVESARDYAILTLDKSLKITGCNAGAEKILGYAETEIVGRPSSIIFTPGDKKSRVHLKEAEHALKNGRFADERWHVRKDKSRFWCSGVLHPLRGPKEEVLGFLKIMRDMTEQKIAEQVKERYKLLVQTIQDYAIFLLDLKGCVTQWNGGATQILGYTPDEALNRHCSIFYTPEERKSGLPEKQLKTARRTGHSVSEGWRIRKDGTRLWVNEVTTPLRNESGVMIGFTKVSRDLTERRHVEEQLRLLNETLEQRVQERTAAMLRYQQELRSMAAQLSKAERLERQRIAEDLHTNLAQLLSLCQIRLSTLRNTPARDQVITELQSYIDQAVRYTRTIMSDLSPPVLQKRNLVTAIKWIAKEMEKHGLHITVNDDGKSKIADEEVLAILFQAVRELLFNVIKHAKTERAIVSLRRLDGMIQIEVADKGIGYNESINKQDPDAGGGFGLFNLRERLSLLGGSLVLKPLKKGGTRVIVTAPLHQNNSLSVKNGSLSTQDKVKERRRRKSNDRRIKVLIADDHKMMREGLKKVLEDECNIEVVGEAPDGEMAVKVARALRPDIVLMDINMPKMDGIEATRRIAVQKAKPVVIGLSIQEDPEVKEAFHQAGGHSYLTKAEAAEELCATIKRHALAARK